MGPGEDVKTDAAVDTDLDPFLARDAGTSGPTDIYDDEM
jgi:hypothetical protein